MCWQVRIQMAVPAIVLARDLAVTAVDIYDGALPARLWNGADLHVVSGTWLPRRWPTCPQLGGCWNHSKTPTSDVSSKATVVVLVLVGDKNAPEVLGGREQVRVITDSVAIDEESCPVRDDDAGVGASNFQAVEGSHRVTVVG